MHSEHRNKRTDSGKMGVGGRNALTCSVYNLDRLRYKIRQRVNSRFVKNRSSFVDI